MINNATVLEINKAAIKFNLAFFKSKLKKKTKILVVVKAFAYGSEAVMVSKILVKQKIDYLAVAYTQEGINLRKAGINLPILVLHPQVENFNLLIKNCLEPNLYSSRTLSKFINILKKLKLKDYPIHIKFNTGLNRLGFKINDVSEVISVIKKEKTIQLKSVFSHLAASEDLKEKDFTERQIASFIAIKKQFEKVVVNKPLFHLLNTSGIVNHTNAQLDMVRLGIGLYGFANEPKITKQLKNVLTLKSKISQIHTVLTGESIGYNRAFTAKKTTRTATIPIGHADGINRKLGNKNGYVTINNKKAFIIGNVCMDMLMVDVTTIDCKENDQVIVFNSQNQVNETASKIDTISYELLTMISQRVKRIIT
jgi:alanine racemase